MLKGRWLRLVVGASVVLLTVQAWTAAAVSADEGDRVHSSDSVQAGAEYEDTGYDPRDAAVPAEPDIVRTKRRAYSTGQGRALKIKFRAVEELGWYWSVRVVIDSSGGPKRDYEMSIANLDNNGTFCYVSPKGEGQRQDGRFEQQGSWASCRVRAGFVHPTKRIRWWVVSRTIEEDPQAIDRAPNAGWYQ